MIGVIMNTQLVHRGPAAEEANTSICGVLLRLGAIIVSKKSTGSIHRW
jgi:hypothetical protein